MNAPLAVRLAEAAQLVGLSERTIKRAISSGALRAKKSAVNKDGDPAGTLLILAKDLTAWLEDLPDA